MFRSAHAISPVLLGALCALAPAPTAQTCTGTVVSGTVVNQTWTTTGSPYCVTGNLTAIGLTILPGVVVQVWPGVSISVGTTLTANGTASQPITFTEASVGQPWGGIVLNNVGSGSSLSYCKIERAGNSGLRIIDSNPTIADCEIVSNATPTTGGGIYASIQSGDLVLTRCKIDKNASTQHGGGISAVLIQGKLVLDLCQFMDNTANQQGNGGNYYGGAVYCTGTGTGLIATDCTIQRNHSVAACKSGTVYGRGGGIYATGTDLTLTRCIIRENQAIANRCSYPNVSRAYGGGIYFNSPSKSLALYNCVLACNTAVASPTAGYGTGGAVEVDAGVFEATNCTIARNTAVGSSQADGGLELTTASFPSTRPSILNSVVYDNVGTQIVGAPTALYCNIQGGYTGTGNINVNPAFLGGPQNPKGAPYGCSSGDLEIAPGSPCMDAGDPSPAYDDVAFPPSLGTTRNDMGANGGPLAKAWVNWQRASISLDVRSTPSTCPSTVTFRTDGGPMTQPAALFLVAIMGGQPVNPPFGVWIPIVGVFSAASSWELTLDVPQSACWASPLDFQSWALTANGALLASNVYRW